MQRTNRIWYLLSGVAVLAVSLFLSAALILRLTLGEQPLPGLFNRVLLPFIFGIVIFFSFVGAAYILMRDGRKPR